MPNTNAVLPYDKTSATSIFEYSKGLLGRTLRNFVWENYKPKKGKGSLGQMVENIRKRLSCNMKIKFPSSTTHQHEFLKTPILYTTYSQTNLWNRRTHFSLTNIQASGWNVRCLQENGNIAVQRLVLLSTLRASALS